MVSYLKLKRCIMCLSDLIDSEECFNKRQGRCLKCQSEYRKIWVVLNSQKKKEYKLKNWHKNNRGKCYENNSESRKAAKYKALFAYGGKCYCCGETNQGFLTIEHLSSNGAEHRRQLFGSPKIAGARFYYWLGKNNYPTNLNLAVACWNCNSGRAHNKGICPHQTERDRIEREAR